MVRRPALLLFRACSVVCVLAVLSVHTAHAQGTKDAKQEAKAHFVSGQTHYNLNEYAEASTEFKAAYRLFPDPVFLYNLGLCERRLGHAEEAINFFRSYLREQPKAPNRQEVQHKIDELEALLKNRAADTDRGVPPAVAESGESRPAAPTPVTPAPAAPATEPSPGASAGFEPKTETATVASNESNPAATVPAAPAIDDKSSTPPGVDVTAPAQPAPVASRSSAFYKSWWFWTAAGAVAVGAGVGVYLMSGQGASGPSTALGSKQVF